jgi:flagellar FliL protein
MTDATAEDADGQKSGTKTTLVLGLILALAGAGGGFYTVSSGLLGGSVPDAATAAGEVPNPLPDVAFVAVDPMIVSLMDERLDAHLRFRTQLEVDATYAADVEKILPRIVDVLNGYLRALEPEDLRDPNALTRLRAQMLRRVQVVAGAGRVRDLLIMEFVLN